MAEISLKGIVISSFDYEEFDKIVTVYSDKYGKLSFIAKGINKPESKNRYSVQNFSVSKYQIFKSRKANSLSKLKTGELIQNNFNITRNYDNYLFASVIISIILESDDFNSKSYQTFVSLEKALNNINQNNDPFSTMVFFLFYLLKPLGGKFLLNRCYRCNKPNKVYRLFDFKECGFVCPNCIRANEQPQDVRFINFLKTIDSETFSTVFNHQFETAYILILCKVLVEHYSHNLGIYTSAMKVLNSKKIFAEDTFENYTHSVLTRNEYLR
ncbi:DNA repair protein RecO [Mesoplasma seiffertii]|uniref:DNA repair protein RecO n=1 Tax=Mesoplasma seiffertii TaxID=28224 RepID=UPI00047DBB82|nr:DNA repair protein RecO [Mesoplasma seiffertii]